MKKETLWQRFKNWLIHKLGGATPEEVEKERKEAVIIKDKYWQNREDELKRKLESIPGSPYCKIVEIREKHVGIIPAEYVWREYLSDDVDEEEIRTMVAGEFGKDLYKRRYIDIKRREDPISLLTEFRAMIKLAKE